MACSYDDVCVGIWVQCNVHKIRKILKISYQLWIKILEENIFKLLYVYATGSNIRVLYLVYPLWITRNDG